MPLWITLFSDERLINVETVDIANIGTYEFSLTALVIPSNIQTSNTFELRLDSLSNQASLTPYFESTEGFSP